MSDKVDRIVKQITILNMPFVAVFSSLQPSSTWFTLFCVNLMGKDLANIHNIFLS